MTARVLPFAAVGLVWISLSSPAFAYLDGATGSMLIQGAIGAIAAAGMFARHYLAKTKSLFGRMFGKTSSNKDR